MNLKHILQEIENTGDQPTERRSLLKGFGSKVALAAIPLGLGAMLNKTYAKTTDDATVADALNTVLELEYFLYNFFHTANNTGALIPATVKPGFEALEAELKAHITFLRNTINGMGIVLYTPKYYTNDPLTGNPYNPASYDFTAGATYPVFHNYSSFLAIAQTFQDMAVRTYGGQISNVLTNTSNTLNYFMRMNAVHARLAAWVRVVRRYNGEVDQPRPWVLKNVPPTIALQQYYNGEDNVMQMNIDITTLPSATGNVNAKGASEAFDEPISKNAFVALIAPFLVD